MVRRTIAAASAAKAFFTRALAVGVLLRGVTTDRARAYPRVLDEHAPAALQDVELYANNNPVEPTVAGSKRGSVQCGA
jgi:hypothetical protein